MDFVTVSVAALWIIVALTLMLLFALAHWSQVKRNGK
jgi:cytochrome oxidase assembly protein ShyY1